MNAHHLPASTDSRNAGQQPPSVYIVIVNWNSGKYTLACLASLQAVSYPNFRVVVVDNGSSDGSPDAIAAAHPDVSIVRLPGNRGFTGGNNEGFRYALEHGADFIYLLNNDTHVAPDFLSEAVKTATSGSGIGIVGSKVMHADRPNRLQFAGARVNLAIGHSGRPFGYDEVDRGQWDHVEDIDRATGCAMMVSRTCLQTIGGLDDAFFIFQEEVDLCLRARAAGFRVVMSPRSLVWHEGGGAYGGAASATHLYYNVRNGLRLVHKHKPMGNRVLDMMRTGCIVGAHAMQVLLNRPTLTAAQGIVDGVRDYYRGVTGARPPKRTHG